MDDVKIQKSDTRVSYFRRRVYDGIGTCRTVPHLTIAIHHHEASRTYVVALAQASADDQPSYRVGRAVALGRLRRGIEICGSAADRRPMPDMPSWTFFLSDRAFDPRMFLLGLREDERSHRAVTASVVNFRLCGMVQQPQEVYTYTPTALDKDGNEV